MTQAQRKLKSTLTKVYAHATQNKNENEADNAKQKLDTLCKKHKINLADFIENCAFDINYTAEAEAEKDSAERKSAKVDIFRSRRAFIISQVTSNIFDSETLAQAIKACFPKYDNISKNKSAITGTLYDLKTKDGYKVTKDSEKRIYCEKC